MVNQNFDRFIHEQEKHKSRYPGGKQKQAKTRNFKDNERGNTDKNIGATGKDV
ncbi:hypothetical protein [Terrihalobacillus insolitus]|uniref:hypothetical protein n=1 Tax=Terrihalobacillus insolitus TaxID=2950438 RepID=UPI0023401629|nr:hypothetical protein [Terrihalobacillus insolitus]MDC3414389.1 hypothetical protein [Terrihalobacillus insolitus]